MDPASRTGDRDAEPGSVERQEGAGRSARPANINGGWSGGVWSEGASSSSAGPRAPAGTQLCRPDRHAFVRERRGAARTNSCRRERRFLPLGPSHVVAREVVPLTAAFLPTRPVPDGREGGRAAHGGSSSPPTPPPGREGEEKPPKLTPSPAAVDLRPSDRPRRPSRTPSPA